LDFRLRLVLEPGRFLLEPAGENGVHILVALVVEPVIGAFEDVDVGLRHDALHLVRAGDQHGRVVGAEHGGYRDAGGGQCGVGILAAAHREVPEGRQQRAAIAPVFHLLTDIALQTVFRREAGFVILGIICDRFHGHHAPEPVSNHRGPDQGRLETLRTRHVKPGRDK